MEEPDGMVALRKAGEAHAKLIALIEKKDRPKPKDSWDKFSSLSGFTASILLAIIGGYFTYTNNERQRQRDKDQKERENKLSLMQFTTQLMPFLAGSEDPDQKRQHAVHILAILPELSIRQEGEIATRLVAEFPTIESTAKQSVAKAPTAANVRALNVLTNPRSLPPVVIAQEVTSNGESGHTILLDGFKNFAVSGFRFSTKSVVAWGADHVDIEVANPDPTGVATAVFFLERDLPPFTAATLQPGREPASAGILEMVGKTYEQVTEAPASGYLYHYFNPRVGGVYCIQTFDGSHYAKIRVTDVLNDRIGFDWQYQPNGRTFL